MRFGGESLHLETSETTLIPGCRTTVKLLCKSWMVTRLISVLVLIERKWILVREHIWTGYCGRSMKPLDGNSRWSRGRISQVRQSFRKIQHTFAHLNKLCRQWKEVDSNVAAITFKKKKILLIIKFFVERLAVAQKEKPFISATPNSLNKHSTEVPFRHAAPLQLGVSYRILTCFMSCGRFYLFMKPVKHKAEFRVADNRCISPSPSILYNMASVK